MIMFSYCDVEISNSFLLFQRWNKNAQHFESSSGSATKYFSMCFSTERVLKQFVVTVAVLTVCWSYGPPSFAMEDGPPANGEAWQQLRSGQIEAPASYDMLRHIMPCPDMSCYDMLRRVTLWYDMSCYICDAMLRHAMLCYVMFCLCYALLYVMLRYANLPDDPRRINIGKA